MIDREYQLSFTTAADERPAILEKYGEVQYDHVIHFAYKSKGNKMEEGKDI